MTQAYKFDGRRCIWRRAQSTVDIPSQQNRAGFGRWTWSERVRKFEGPDIWFPS
jgi:ATP-dependent DNA ligase